MGRGSILLFASSYFSHLEVPHRNVFHMIWYRYSILLKVAMESVML